jgi:hypothetical protein
VSFVNTTLTDIHMNAFIGVVGVDDESTLDFQVPKL